MSVQTTANTANPSGDIGLEQGKDADDLVRELLDRARAATERVRFVLTDSEPGKEAGDSES